MTGCSKYHPELRQRSPSPGDKVVDKLAFGITATVLDLDVDCLTWQLGFHFLLYQVSRPLRGQEGYAKLFRVFSRGPLRSRPRIGRLIFANPCRFFDPRPLVVFPHVTIDHMKMEVKMGFQGRSQVTLSR